VQKYSLKYLIATWFFIFMGMPVLNTIVRMAVFNIYLFEYLFLFANICILEGRQLNLYVNNEI